MKPASAGCTTAANEHGRDGTAQVEAAAVDCYNRSIPPRPTPRRLLAGLVLAAVLASVNGCAGAHALVPRSTQPETAGLPLISWFGPSVLADGASLDRWRASVGPPVVVSREVPAMTSDALTVVSWNIAIGAGDVGRMVADLRKRIGDGAPLVLLLQEVYRGGPEVPRLLGPGATFASRLRGLRGDGGRDEVETIAESLGMSVYYVPSMRNGAPGASDEDRGNAILSTLPLTELSAIELPFERQRRVAVTATVSGVRGDGTPWRLRMVSAHLDNMVGARRLWIAGGEYGRARQARGLVGLLQDEAPTVLGADLNTWFGFADQVYVETARAFPQTQVTDRRATFRGILRLDHLFYRLPAGWSAGFRRADSSFGSDHYPLVATIRLM